MTLLKATIILLCGLMAFLVENSSSCQREQPKTTPAPAPTTRPGQSCCSGKTTGRTEPQMVPYTGGIDPADNNDATVCFFHRNSRCLTCTGPSSQSQCCTSEPTGPIISLNEYLIHDMEKGKYELCPYNAETSLYLSQFQEDQSGNAGWSIHDENSEGNKGVDVDDACWVETKNTIDEGSLTYKDLPLKGFLYVTDE